MVEIIIIMDHFLCERNKTVKTWNITVKEAITPKSSGFLAFNILAKLGIDINTVSAFQCACLFGNWIINLMNYLVDILYMHTTLFHSLAFLDR